MAFEVILRFAFILQFFCRALTGAGLVPVSAGRQ
jgi:hypothetical protein